ncbi:alpha/beta hydrolase [Candidatus Thiosymbion oneisti]|uniref:alpha/beta hydrolase n=1 Tax=Candidatus Thiosymbion oneisti TaxID=589554 RepID=UPI000B31635F|nr:alpha/beta hydrolase [Candidatus Thiosymbion oneisti]
MLFITNRFPKQSIRTRPGRNLDFDLNNNAASNSVFFCERTGDQTYTEIGSIEFLSRIKKNGYRQVLIYIHGFSNLPEDVFGAVQELQELCNNKKNNEVLVIPLVWPCDNDLGIIKDYWDDQESADASAYSSARVLGKFSEWQNSDKYNHRADPCLKRINVLAHSMGTRVLRETLVAWNKYNLSGGVPLIFRNTFLVAADIANESLQRGGHGELICHASRNVIVYHAADDLALRASKFVNLKSGIVSRRLGHTGPENMRLTPANVYALDCDDISMAYCPVGHSYFSSGRTRGQPGLVFEHIFRTLISGRVFPDDESQRTTIIKEP